MQNGDIRKKFSGISLSCLGGQTSLIAYFCVCIDLFFRMGIEGSESEESDDEERAMEASSDPSNVSTSSRDERDSPSSTSDQEALPDPQPSRIDVQASEDCKGSSSTEAKHPLLAALPVPGEDSSGSGGDGSNKSTDNVSADYCSIVNASHARKFILERGQGHFHFAKGTCTGKS